jgi:hypothetical protein
MTKFIRLGVQLNPQKQKNGAALIERLKKINNCEKSAVRANGAMHNRQIFQVQNDKTNQPFTSILSPCA